MNRNSITTVGITAIAVVVLLASQAPAAAAGTGASVRQLGAQLAKAGNSTALEGFARRLSADLDEMATEPAARFLARHRAQLTPYQRGLVELTVLVSSRKSQESLSALGSGRRLAAPGQRVKVRAFVMAFTQNPAVRHFMKVGAYLQRHPSELARRLQALLARPVAADTPQSVQRIGGLLSGRGAVALLRSLPPLIAGVLLDPGPTRGASSSLRPVGGAVDSRVTRRLRAGASDAALSARDRTQLELHETLGMVALGEVVHHLFTSWVEKQGPALALVLLLRTAVRFGAESEAHAAALALLEVAGPIGWAIGALLAAKDVWDVYRALQAIRQAEEDERAKSQRIVASLEVFPNHKAVAAGTRQKFLLTALNPFHEPIGSVAVGPGPAEASLSISPNGECLADSCGSKAGGRHEVTATLNGNPAVKGHAEMIVEPPTIEITPASLGSTVPGVIYSRQLSANGGFGSIKWSAPSLPNGLQLDASTGVISGRAAYLGENTVHVVAEDEFGNRGTLTTPLNSDPPTCSGNPCAVAYGSQEVTLAWLRCVCTAPAPWEFFTLLGSMQKPYYAAPTVSGYPSAFQGPIWDVDHSVGPGGVEHLIYTQDGPGGNATDLVWYTFPPMPPGATVSFDLRIYAHKADYTGESYETKLIEYGTSNAVTVK